MKIPGMLYTMARIGKWLHPRLSAFICGSFALVTQAQVTAKDAWVRGTVPAQTSTGAFVTLTSAADAKVLSAASPAAKTVEIHESMTMGGVSHMHAVDALPLPAGEPVELKPGGHHLMLMGLAKPLKAGERVPITFTIEEKGGKRVQLQVDAEVRPLGSR